MKFQRLSFIQFWSVLALLISLFACKPENISPAELVEISEAQGEFLLYDPDNSHYAFEILTNNQEGNKIEYVKIYLSIENGASYLIKKASSFPTQIRISLSQALEIIKTTQLSDLTRESSIKVQFFAKKENTGDKLLPSKLVLKISCPEPGIEGIYESTSYGVSGPGGGGKFSGIVSTVEIIALGPYEFQISDATGGVFREIWAAQPESAYLREYCRNLEFPTFTDQFDDNFSGQAKLQTDASIELRWQSSYGDRGVSVFRKK